jgi:hypothetical protein
MVNSRGEPVDFSFVRIDVHASFLWRQGAAHRQAVVALCRALFTAAVHVPNLIVTLAAEVPPRVFGEDLEVAVPLCRVAGPDALAYAPAESIEEGPDAQNLFWAGPPPPVESDARALLDALITRKSLTEPFERAALGLQEAFASA